MSKSDNNIIFYIRFPFMPDFELNLYNVRLITRSDNYFIYWDAYIINKSIV